MACAIESPEKILNIEDDHEVSESEQGTRFACGALLGAFIALAIILSLSLSSFGMVAAVFVFCMMGTGFLALVLGDRFWLGLKDLLQS
jgi:hypothetical protein